MAAFVSRSRIQLHQSFARPRHRQHFSVAMGSASIAVTEQQYTDRVAKVLQYAQEHPLEISSRPMAYERDPGTPLPSVVAGLTPADVTTKQQPSDMATVVAGLLYIACGGLDEAHNLVTPLSWSGTTSYGGQPKLNSPAQKEAIYAHALVHRGEGNCDGEFGSGFSNANYWYAAVNGHAIYPDVLNKAKELAAGDAQLEQLVANHGTQFEPSRFVSLCQRALDKKDPTLLKFCNQLINQEWRLLFDYCYSRL